jgi:hypothetical protein
MATLIFLFSIVSSPISTGADTVEAPQAPQAAGEMRYYGVEKLLAKFEQEA